MVLQKMALGIYGEMHAALRVCFLKSVNLTRFITCHLQLRAMSPRTQIRPEGTIDSFAHSCEPAVGECGKMSFHNSDYFGSVQGIGCSC